MFMDRLHITARAAAASGESGDVKAEDAMRVSTPCVTPVSDDAQGKHAQQKALIIISGCIALYTNFC